MKNTEDKEEGSKQKQDEEEKKKGVKRKFDPSEFSDDKGDDSEKENEKNSKTMNMKKAKNVGFSFFFRIILDIQKQWKKFGFDC